MSYNVLADQLATPQFHPGQSMDILKFSFRSTRLIEEISQSDASLLCLQEVDHIDDFYEAKLNAIGFNIAYGMRELSTLPG